jgi:hypothetical protein
LPPLLVPLADLALLFLLLQALLVLLPQALRPAATA